MPAMEGSQSTVAMTTFRLPFEMIIEILSRLPVKSLLRFKSVCRTWYDLIETPHFISKHLLTHSTRNHTPLLENSLNLVTDNREFSLIYNDGFNSGPINLDFPFLDRRNYGRTSRYGGEYYISIGGICNGLVCVGISCFGYHLFLCNPSTRQFREILNPEWNNENLYGGQVSFGFGFHPSANDYKLIRIVLYFTHGYSIQADLYVMSTDTWTEINVNKLSLFLGEMNEGGEYDSIVQIGGSSATALNGVFYWPALVVPTDQVLVMSFDMGNEVFRRIRTPECLDKTGNLYNWQFTELDDKIALVISDYERGFDVWLLNENESCWTNQIKVGPFPSIARDMGYGVDGDITMVGGGKNGELLVWEHKYSGELKFFSYDIKTRETMDLYCGLVPYTSSVYLYAGTLLPVMQANEIALNK
ncbi:hypothetical protein RHMOL_Rhmol05G0299900 [Rhododendron molle]|uniref:Uncharacterized protein n=1 Tax=Rhododendron molle TaxID=49168 RepID=A0ACC0NUH0_RHOML|nr:hypothetical protein RHMOL_Rhmol05G0299900 [Rhododendron molle]